MKYILPALAIVVSITTSHAQTVTTTQEKLTVAILGSFHFAGSSDLIALEVEDLKTAKRKNEILELVDALASFGPTKVILEYPYGNGKLDSLYQEYTKGKHDLTINERQQIGFRVAAKMNHANVYTADHRMNLPFGELMGFLEENNRTEEFNEVLETLKTEVLSLMQTAYDDSSIKEYFVWLNDEKFDNMNKNFYLQKINGMGASDNYIGTELAAKWWERNFRIMRNIDEITEPHDRVLILFGQGHTALLKDFYEGRDDIVYVDILDYLRE